MATTPPLGQPSGAIPPAPPNSSTASRKEKFDACFPAAPLPSGAPEEPPETWKRYANYSPEPPVVEASIEVSSALVFEVLTRLSNSSVLAPSFFRWGEKQTGFEYATDSYNLLVESLGKAKQFRLIWVTVHEMKEKKGLD
ncbi:hypothetical protein Tsubulata_024238 [Turnera subulata]|uniref:Uncharacterized protein n=1 Tax=Turnera subulata TaxID=218843 RepID=A0A9Q0FD96_9ROSI|nr:hypothetical protein Tsubulata_024238 [Turnera subulata]